MSGGVSRPNAFRYFPVLVTLSMLAGCSVLFGPRPNPETEQAAPPEAASEGPPAAVPEAAASAPAAPSKHEALEAKRPPARKPAYRPPRRTFAPAQPAPAPAPPPSRPPIITMRLLSQEQVHALLDSKVQRPDGRIVGRAVDMIADANGKPRDMIVNLSGFLGIGDRKMNFPWSAFRFGPALKKAPIMLEIGPGEAPALDAPKTKTGRAPTPASKLGTVAQAPLMLPLIDATVQRGNGSKVGRVIDVLIDSNAQPQAAVLDVGSLISHDRRSIAADWSALRFVTKDKSLELQTDLTDAQIRAAPPYAPDQPVRAVSPVVAPASVPAATAPAGGSSSGALASSARSSR
jgi:hypothetical protein